MRTFSLSQISLILPLLSGALALPSKTPACSGQDLLNKVVKAVGGDALDALEGYSFYAPYVIHFLPKVNLRTNILQLLSQHHPDPKLRARAL